MTMETEMNTSTVELQTLNGIQMMSSRNIALVVLKGHKEVCRDIRVMLVQLYGGEEKDYIRSANLLYVTNQGVDCIQYDTSNPNAWEYLLDYEHSQCLSTGYDALRRMSMVKQWRAMKENIKQPRIAAQPAPKEFSMNNDLLSLARVVAEATASATMKAVIDVAGFHALPQPVVAEPAAITPQPTTANITVEAAHDKGSFGQAEFVPVADLAWDSGFSDAACRRIATFAKLQTCLSSGDRGRLLIHRESFMSAAQALLDGSTPPAGKRQRWQHPEFGGFTLRLKSTGAVKGEE